MQPYQESSLLKLSNSIMICDGHKVESLASPKKNNNNNNSIMIDLIDWMAQNLYEPEIEDIASMKIQFKSQ